MLKIILLIAGILSLGQTLKGQDNNIYSEIGVGGNFISKNHVPFWLRSNQFGSIPPPGNSGSIYGNFKKYYDTVDQHLIDWGGSLEGRINLGDKTEGIIVEGYLKTAISIFEIKAGRVKEIMGLVDSTLSTGAFSMSGNALGIPKLEISIPEYYEIPVLGGVFAFKGNFAYGWVGDVPVQTHNIGVYKTHFNQSSFYGRIGNESWKLNLFGGFNHEVFFGNEKSIFGNGFKLSGWQSFVDVATGKTYQGSKIGNHIGSIDLAASYNFDNFRIFVYRQNFYDEGALFHLANLADGLNGISITNQNESTGSFHWNKLILEFFYSANQAGYPWSKITPSGDENYYNNYEYANGYSYKGQAIGNPLISAAKDTRTFPNNKGDYFNNNRVSAIHIAAEASIHSIVFTGKLTYSDNLGTFSTSPYGSSRGSLRIPPVGHFKKSKQVSGFLQIVKHFEHGYSASMMLASDRGQLLYNSIGASFRISKSF